MPIHLTWLFPILRRVSHSCLALSSNSAEGGGTNSGQSDGGQVGGSNIEAMLSWSGMGGAEP